MSGMFSGLSSGLAGQLANNVLSPALNRMTGDNRAGEIGANIFRDNMPGMIGSPQQPGYQMPTPGQPELPDVEPNTQGNEQYFLQMRQSIDSLNEAMKQIQGMQTPGGQYNSDMGMMSPGSNYHSGAK
jgi:hypothetical protein